ncbi:hypothetical protein FGO68_gene4923 [Halteria grandinella]|uniref:Uncharacterized protein n=1 Tax=Halteria grandinella TaxID=5974 RepID=A0A8J8T5C0_HALGN|nr:hypothetical protein FGO68_gene4923 [Halteria grandinella]
MVRESSGIREKNLEQMVRNGEEKSELYLERHIRDQLKNRHHEIKSKLSDDDNFEYVMIGVLAIVAGVGIMMWRKIKEQQSVLL